MYDQSETLFFSSSGRPGGTQWRKMAFSNKGSEQQLNGYKMSLGELHEDNIINVV